jgi:hypothetical protein
MNFWAAKHFGFTAPVMQEYPNVDREHGLFFWRSSDAHNSIRLRMDYDGFTQYVPVGKQCESFI